MSDNPILKVERISKSFESGDEQLLILNELDFSLDNGQSAVILGRSGSGKSTFLHLIGGLDQVDTGSIIVDGKHIEKMRPSGLERYRREEIGFIFQSHFLIDDFTIRENVALPAIMNGARRKDAYERAENLLEQVGIANRMEHYPKKISGGERQRAAVARALINDPILILADEPTGNLDEFNSRLVEDMLFRLVEEGSRNLIMVTHDESISSRGSFSYTLSSGRLEARSS